MSNGNKNDKENDHHHSNATTSPRLRKVVSWLAVIGATFTGAFFIYALFDWGRRRTGQMTEIALAQFPTIIGLPFAALAALCLVLILEARAGPIEFEALGFKFRGASGPLVLWIFCFLAVVLAIKTLWIAPS